MAKNKSEKQAVSTKKKSHPKGYSQKMPCVCSLYYFDFEGSPLSPRINRYWGILASSRKIKPTTGTNLGISISSPIPGGIETTASFTASGSVTNDGRATVTVWLTDASGTVTNGTVDYSSPPNWSATFEDVPNGTYFLSAQAVLDNESACQTIQITVDA